VAVDVRPWSDPGAFFLLLVLTVQKARAAWLRTQISEAEAVLRSYSDEAATRLLRRIFAQALNHRGGETLERSVDANSAQGTLCCGRLHSAATGDRINTIIYYGPQIFALAGIGSDKNAIFATLLVAIVNVLATIIALLLVDRLGRKPLLYWGVGGMTLSLLVLAYAFKTRPTGTFTRHDCHRMFDGVHQLLCIQHGANCLDHCCGGVSSAPARAAAWLPPHWAPEFPTQLFRSLFFRSSKCREHCHLLHLWGILRRDLVLCALCDA